MGQRHIDEKFAKETRALPRKTWKQAVAEKLSHKTGQANC